MTKMSVSARIGLSLAVVGFQSCSPAFAVPTSNPGNGHWRAHECGGASALFTPPLKNAQATKGFGGTSTCGNLVVDNSEGQTAGLTVKFSYTQDDSTRSNDFRNVTFLFNAGGNNGAKKNTTVTFCFQKDHGAGGMIALPVTLNKISTAGTDAGFTFATQTSRDFGGISTQDMVLRKMTFALTGSASNMKIGDTQVSIGLSGNVIDPVGINFADSSCSGLHTCNEEDEK